MAGFDFAASEVNEALVRQLRGGNFMESADNVVLIGGPRFRSHLPERDGFTGIHIIRDLLTAARLFSQPGALGLNQLQLASLAEAVCETRSGERGAAPHHPWRRGMPTH